MERALRHDALSYDVTDPIDDRRWLRLVERDPDATIFHHPGWLGLLREQYGYPFLAPCLVDQAGNLTAGLPIARVTSRLTGRRLVAVPFSDACPPLGASEPGRAAQLGRAVMAVASEEAIDLEIRADMQDVVGSSTAVVRYVTHTLDLSAEAGPAERRFSAAARRGVAKAERAGLCAERRIDADALRIFYGLHLATRRRLGVPTQPKRFIARFAELFGEGLGFVAIVRAGQRPLAAAVFLRAGRTLTYKYGASDHGQLGLRPNNLLFARAIQWARDDGCGIVDFGRTDLDNLGLRAFKRAWGAHESDLAYTYAPPRPARTGSGRGEKVLSAAIRHMPQDFGRLAGELLYRHAG